MTLTAAGQADIGFYYQEDTIIARANEDVPVKVHWRGGPEPHQHRLLPWRRRTSTPEDLVGKTIGYARHPASARLPIGSMLADCGG